MGPQKFPKHGGHSPYEADYMEVCLETEPQKKVSLPTLKGQRIGGEKKREFSQTDEFSADTSRKDKVPKLYLNVTGQSGSETTRAGAPLSSKRASTKGESCIKLHPGTPQRQKRSALEVSNEPSGKRSASKHSAKDLVLDDCSICFDPLEPKDSVFIPCRHQFHIECCYRWVLEKDNCPLCREQLPQSTRLWIKDYLSQRCKLDRG